MSDVEHQPSSDTEAAIIDVEVAFALPDRQQIVVLKVQQGCTAYQAAELSGIAGQFAEIGLENTLTSFGLLKGRDFSMQHHLENLCLQ